MHSVEIIDLRHLRAHDLAALLDEEKGLWQRHLLWDYSGSADLIKRFVESRSLPGYVAREGERTVGYTFYVYEEQKGLIGNLFVAPSFRGATEERLLVHTIETLRGTPGVRRIEAQLMMLGTAAIAEAFARSGFRSHARKFMFLPLPAISAPFPLPPRLQPDLDFQTWHDRMFEDAAALITRAYHGHVDSLINDQYRSLAGALRFLRNITQYPGCGVFHPAGALAAFPRGTRKMCGLILTSVVAPGVGHITQVCATPEIQGRGLGYELVRRAAAYFHSQGFGGVSLTVTSANHRAVTLYERMGFSTLREFNAYVWDHP